MRSVVDIDSNTLLTPEVARGISSHLSAILTALKMQTENCFFRTDPFLDRSVDSFFFASFSCWIIFSFGFEPASSTHTSKTPTNIIWYCRVVVYAAADRSMKVFDLNEASWPDH